MDPFNGGGFPFNVNGTLNTEIFDYRRRADPYYRLMLEPEILVQQPQQYDPYGYPSSYNQQMHQLYYDDDRYGNEGYHSPRHGYNYPYTQQPIPFDMNHEIVEYPRYQISVDIRLSSRRNIDNLTIGLHREGLSCSVRGSVITVTGYPDNSGANGFLRLVQDISGDRRASIVR